MQAEAFGIYRAAFVEYCDAVRRPGQQRVHEPGIDGLLAGAGDRRLRLLVADDRGYGVLASLLPDAQAGTINVLAAAARCAELVEGDSAWRPKAATAMVCRDLLGVPAVSLPNDLAVRTVRRRTDDAPDGVPLEDAVALAVRADSEVDGPPETLGEYLRSLPAKIRLFAAVDSGGVVRATSGFGITAADANVFFVNTDPDWRRRGVGYAMTAVALRAARDGGACRACLDASDAGRRIYLGLGFEPVTQTTRFHQAG